MLNKVAAVIVTFNRIELLKECISSLRSQTKKLDEIIIINNGSTDGTAAWLSEQKDLFFLNQENIGGAGGFHKGIETAYNRGNEWLWVMDDDTIPDLNAFQAFEDAFNTFTTSRQPIVMASKVNWTDGELHPMNISWFKKRPGELLIEMSEKGFLPLRSTSFVSVFLNRKAVEIYGLPLAHYFIWNDDFEYTARILKTELGIYVPKSLVTHKTIYKYTPITGTGTRFYYEVRNKFFILIYSNSFTFYEKLLIFAKTAQSSYYFLRHSNFNLKNFYIILKGCTHGCLNIYKKH